MVSGTTTWRDVLAMGLTGFGIAWFGMAGLAVARILGSGMLPDWTVLLNPPIDFADLVFLPIMVGLLSLEVLHSGWQTSALARFASGGSMTDRTDVFYLLANCTGLATVLSIVFTFGAVLGVEHVFGLTTVFRFASILPVWVQIPVLYIIGDFGEYWVHRFMHSKLMWPLHAVHHSAEHMSVLTAARHHPLDGFIGSLPYTLAGVILGFSPDAVFIVGTIGVAHTSLVHSSLQIPLWIERYLVSGSRLHTLHHSRDVRHYDTNFGLIVLWDRLFGTYLIEETSGVVMGVDDPRFDTGRPFRDMWAVTSIWSAGIWARARSLNAGHGYDEDEAAFNEKLTAVIGPKLGEAPPALKPPRTA